jgi:hypothetical protein
MIKKIIKPTMNATRRIASMNHVTDVCNIFFYLEYNKNYLMFRIGLDNKYRTVSVPITHAQSDSRYFLKTGGDIIGAVNVQSISSPFVPVSGEDLTNKSYVDSSIAAINSQGEYLRTDGGQLTGNVDIGQNKITSSHVPVSPEDMANKAYVDSVTTGGVTETQADLKYLKLTGGTMVGDIDMGGNSILSTSIPINDNELVNKGYVDSTATFTEGQADMKYLQLVGGTLNGNVDMGANHIRSSSIPLLNSDLTNKAYVDSIDTFSETQSDLKYLQLTGGTMTGDIIMGTSRIISSVIPTQAGDVVNKAYVDNIDTISEDLADNRYLQLSGGELTGNLNMGQNKVTSSAVPIAGDDLINVNYVDSNYLGLDGGTLTGALTLHGDPTSDLHCVSKAYVDNIDTLSESQANNLYLKLTGGVLAGNLAMGSNKVTSSAIPSTGNDLVNRSFTDSHYLNLTGGTMTGALTLHGDPTSNLHCASKAYVDSEILAVSGGGGGSEVFSIEDEVSTPVSVPASETLGHIVQGIGSTFHVSSSDIVVADKANGGRIFTYRMENNNDLTLLHTHVVNGPGPIGLLGKLYRQNGFLFAQIDTGFSTSGTIGLHHNIWTVFRISPDRLDIIGSIPSTSLGYLRGIHMIGNYVYSFNNSNKLLYVYRIVFQSGTWSIVFETTVSGPSNNYLGDNKMLRFGTVLFYTDTSSNAVLFDITNPASPTFIREQSWAGSTGKHIVGTSYMLGASCIGPHTTITRISLKGMKSNFNTITTETGVLSNVCAGDFGILPLSSRYAVVVGKDADPLVIVDLDNISGGAFITKTNSTVGTPKSAIFTGERILVTGSDGKIRSWKVNGFDAEIIENNILNGNSVANFSHVRSQYVESDSIMSANANLSAAVINDNLTVAGVIQDVAVDVYAMWKGATTATITIPAFTSLFNVNYYFTTPSTSMLNHNVSTYIDNIGTSWMKIDEGGTFRITASGVFIPSSSGSYNILLRKNGNPSNITIAATLVKNMQGSSVIVSLDHIIELSPGFHVFAIFIDNGTSNISWGIRNTQLICQRLRKN